MIRTFSAAFFGLLAITAPADADAPVIVIDRWWGVDYAKVDCRIPAFKPPGQSEATCEQERTQSYNVFEMELKTQFAALPECSGITVLSFGYPQDSTPPDITKLSYWSFSLNYQIQRGPEQLWQMLSPRGTHLPVMQAKGTPPQIAKQVCTIINGKGGTVR